MSTLDYFLRVDGIKGSSTDFDHKDEFDVLGYEFDLAAAMAAAAGGGAGTGKATFSPLIVDLAKTAGLADLLADAASGQHIATVTFMVRHPGEGQRDYEIIKLSDVTILGYEEQSGFAPRVALG